MSIIKVIEVMANSSKGWEDAAQSAVSEASRSLHNIRSIHVQEMSAVVEGGEIVEYRINGKISFELDYHENGHEKAMIAAKAITKMELSPLK